MALRSISLLVYGIEVTAMNQNLDFKAAMAGPTLTAVLNLGFYSLTGLANEIVRAMQVQDSVNTYTCTINRNILAGTQNRITISTNGTFLSLLFGTGPNASIGVYSLIGFNQADYTGSTSYTGNASVGTFLMTSQIGYSYTDSVQQTKVFGVSNVAASGLKEAVTFNFQKFIDVTFKYEPRSKLDVWMNFFLWAIQQRPFDFTPEIIFPNSVFDVTLEKTVYDGKGLGYKMSEMIPKFPNFYDTGNLNFRVSEDTTSFT